MRVDTALVRELAELLSANDLNEIEVEDGERKIKVRRDAPTAFVAAPRLSCRCRCRSGRCATAA